MKFKNDLLSYGITYEDLVRKAPKHHDTKLLCINIAKKLASSDELSEKLASEKRLSVSELTGAFGINRKTVENHRNI
jgi:RNA polymerase sigma factor